jgi:glycosyltransferase involved in cell wall biosynthesis
VRNGALFLPSTIESVLRQTEPNWEYLIVDDASDDQTPAALRAYADRDERIKVITRNSSGGPYVAANEGLREARGRFVARLDADDIALPQRLELQAAFLAANPRLRSCAGYWQQMSEEGRPEEDVRTLPTSAAVLPWYLCVRSGFVHSSAFIDRSALIDLGGYEPLPVSQDFRLWCHFARRRELGVVPDVVVMWRRHGSSIGSRGYERQVEAHLLILEHHLRELTQDDWSEEATRALFDMSRARPVSLRDGMDALDRWEAAWREDPLLGPRDRRELMRLGTWLRLRNLKWNGRKRPAQLPRALGRTVLRGLGRGPERARRDEAQAPGSSRTDVPT